MHTTQILDAWTGVSGKGVPFNAVSVNDAINFAVAVRNLDAANSRGLQVLRADGTVLLQVDTAGVKASPDGGAATAVVTSGATQTLTNKTLTAPITVLAGPTANTAFNITGTYTGAVGASAVGGINSQANIQPGNNGETVYGGFIGPTPLANAKTGLTAVGLGINMAPAPAGYTNAQGIRIGTVSGASGGNYGLLIDAPTGANAFGIVNNGGVQVNGAGTSLGFFATGFNGQQTVTGSRGANAALASLLTALASYGLIVNSSTA